MKTALAWIGGALLAILLAWGALHVLISPVNPAQEAPEKHFGGQCWACHFMSESAKITTDTP